MTMSASHDAPLVHAEPTVWLQLIAEEGKWAWLSNVTSRANARFAFRELAVFCRLHSIECLDDLRASADRLEAGLYVNYLETTRARLRAEILRDDDDAAALDEE